MRRLVLLTVALAACLPASALAATGWKPAGVGAYPSEEAKLAAALPIARSYWRGSACAGREQIVLRASDPPVEAPSAQGWGTSEGCRVWIRAGLPFPRFCYVLAHELGHAAGREHEPDSRSIMAPDTAHVGPCSTTRSIGASWYAAVDLLPEDGRGWHVRRRSATLGIATHPRYRCSRILSVDADAFAVDLLIGRCS